MTMKVGTVKVENPFHQIYQHLVHSITDHGFLWFNLIIFKKKKKGWWFPKSGNLSINNKHQITSCSICISKHLLGKETRLSDNSNKKPWISQRLKGTNVPTKTCRIPDIIAKKRSCLRCPINKNIPFWLTSKEDFILVNSLRCFFGFIRKDIIRKNQLWGDFSNNSQHWVILLISASKLLAQNFFKLDFIEALGVLSSMYLC